MARTYISKDNKTYELHKGYGTGNVIILSEDMGAWRMSSKTLTAASSVFKDMFNYCPSDTNELSIPDCSRESLYNFVRIIHGRLISANTRGFDIIPAIELLIRFECRSQAVTTLYRFVEDLAGHNVYQAFVLASKLNDRTSSSRIIAQGWKAEVGADKSLLPAPIDDYRVGNAHRFWKTGDAESIQASWVWALSLAEISCLKKGDSNESCQFWRSMVGEFMIHLVS